MCCKCAVSTKDLNSGCWCRFDNGGRECNGGGERKVRSELKVFIYFACVRVRLNNVLVAVTRIEARDMPWGVGPAGVWSTPPLTRVWCTALIRKYCHYKQHLFTWQLSYLYDSSMHLTCAQAHSSQEV